jgi:hypothetical protein
MSFQKLLESPNPKGDGSPGSCDDKAEREDLITKAQPSLAKVASPPHRRGSGRALPNDSLDAMRLDFLNDYNKIMQATDLEGNSAVKKSAGASSHAYFSGLKHSRLGG